MHSPHQILLQDYPLPKCWVIIFRSYNGSKFWLSVFLAFKMPGQTIRLCSATALPTQWLTETDFVLHLLCSYFLSILIQARSMTLLICSAPRTNCLICKSRNLYGFNNFPEAENSFIFLLGTLQFCKFFMDSEVKFRPLLSGSMSACALWSTWPLWYPVLLHAILIIRQGWREREID